MEGRAAMLSVTRAHCPGSVSQHATTTERKRQSAREWERRISNYLVKL